jgi:hypothetical protein
MTPFTDTLALISNKCYIPCADCPEKITLTIEAQQSRVDALVRLLGLIVMVFGIALVYFTYSNAGVSGIAPEIVTINYGLGLLLTIVGLFATFAKFK